jgi:predicted ATP-grasp superfamily ATP-dependent carboligase
MAGVSGSFLGDGVGRWLGSSAAAVLCQPVGATLLLNTAQVLPGTARRVIVTDAQERAVLAALRGLAPAGFHVTAVGNGRLAPGLWSRAASARRLAPDPRRDLAGFLTTLESLVREGRFAVLLPGTDASLLAVSTHRERFEPHVRLALPPHEVVTGALDKRRLAKAAARVDLAVPEEQVCTTIEQARAAAQDFGFPVVVKPAETVVVLDGITRRRASALAHDQGELEAAVRFFGACIVQRRAQGRVISVGGVATPDGLLAHVASRYTRMWPADGGNVAFSETIEAPASLIERVQALVEGLRWQGMFEVELIERPDGSYSAIDFNPRAYGSLSLATAAGVCLPALWCQWVLGEGPVSNGRAALGVRYRWEDADLRYVARALSEGRLRPAMRAMRPRRGVTHAYFQLRDPLPALGRTFQLVSMSRERPAHLGRYEAVSRGTAGPRRS